MAFDKKVVDKYGPMMDMKLSQERKEQLWSQVEERIARNDKVDVPGSHKNRLVTTAAVAVAVAIVGVGTYMVTHDTTVHNVSTAQHQQHVKSQQWNSSYWSSANPSYLSPELLQASKTSLVVRVVGGNVPGGEKTESIELTPKTTTWSNGKMVPFVLSRSSLRKGEFFTVITEKKGNGLVAKHIYAPDSQVYGIVQGVNGDVVTVKQVNQSDYKNYTGRVLKLKFDHRTNFNGASPADLKPGYLVQSQVTGKYPGLMLMYGVQISKSKKLPSGVTQWSSVGNRTS